MTPAHSRLRPLPTSASSEPRSVPALGTAILVGFEQGHPLVQTCLRDTPLRAQTIVPLGPADVGQRLVYACEAADPERPIIMGILVRVCEGAAERPKLEVSLDGERLVLSATREIVLRCGKASLVLSADGNVRVHGQNVASTATGKQRIRGATVKIN